MAAIGALIKGDLAPVGNRIYFQPVAANTSIPVEFDNYESVFVDSGTSALALAMTLARELKPHIQSPEVIFPGYGCPDLIAAAEYAGVKPVLADISCDDPGYDLACLREAITPNTLLIVAVNFLGIRERLADIQAIADEKDILLVEDNAQWFPEPYPGVALSADFVLTSFGRGKPVSLLGGGMLLVRRALGLVRQQMLSRVAQASTEKWLMYKIRLFNVLLNPRFYYWLNRNPLVPLGETVFHPLEQIKALDSWRCSQLIHCVALYQEHSFAVEQGYDRQIGQGCSGIQLPMRYDRERRGRLLRYPLICETRLQRDQLLSALQAKGLGATGYVQGSFAYD